MMLMGNLQYSWWSYVQAMIRDYPARLRMYDKLNRVEKREYEAVREAVKLTLLKEDGKERIQLIRRVFWRRDSRTIAGIAMDLFISRATAFRWMADFILLVAERFGIYDPE